MTTAKLLQKELNEFNAKREAGIADDSVKSDFPKSKKTFTYRKQTIITGLQAIA